jgi:hypothetical protein
MAEAVTVVDVMGLVFLGLALAVALVANTRLIPGLSAEERELLAGGSLCIAMLGTFFVVAE